MTETQSSKRLPAGYSHLEHPVIWISNLFRISILGFRHSPLNPFLERINALRAICLLLTCLFLASGCAISSRCRITVGNATENIVTDVVVKADQDVLYQITSVKPRASAPYWDMDRDIPKSLLVSWKEKDNKSVSKKITLKGDIPESFRGRVYFQIGRDGEVKPFITPDTNDTSTDMPWNKPESWEGIPGIPGLTTQ